MRTLITMYAADAGVILGAPGVTRFPVTFRVTRGPGGYYTRWPVVLRNQLNPISTPEPPRSTNPAPTPSSNSPVFVSVPQVYTAAGGFRPSFI